MLSDKAHETDKYLGYVVNKKTRNANAKKWERNIQMNKEHYIKGNPLPKGLVTYLVGAGPSLDKNIEELKNIGNRGVIVCIDANLEILIKAGVKPEYCVSLDASNKVYNMLKKVVHKTKDITLVANTASNPKIIAKWQGAKFFFSSMTPRFPSKVEEFMAKTRHVVANRNIKKGEALVVKENFDIKFPGVMIQLSCGGNVTTSAHAFCMHCLKATTVVFVGCDFSWEHDSHFYVGYSHQENIRQRVGNENIFDWKNVYKKRVFTNYSMHSFKQWHESFAMQYPYTSINATEGGILGVDEKGKQEPSWGFANLKDVVKQYSPKREDKFIRTKYKIPTKIKAEKVVEEKIDPAVKESMDKVATVQAQM